MLISHIWQQQAIWLSNKGIVLSMTSPSSSLLLLTPLSPHLISLALSHFIALSIPGRFIALPFFSHTPSNWQNSSVYQDDNCVTRASHYFVLQAERLICGEVFALTNNNSAKLLCIALWNPLWYQPTGDLHSQHNEHWLLSLKRLSSGSLRSHRLIWMKSNGATLSLFVSAVEEEKYFT